MIDVLFVSTIILSIFISLTLSVDSKYYFDYKQIEDTIKHVWKTITDKDAWQKSLDNMLDVDKDKLAM